MDPSRVCGTDPDDTDVPPLTLINVVGTFVMCGKGHIDLPELAMRSPWMEFNPKRFAAGIIRIARPKTTCLIFASGKGVCTGARDEDSARLAALTAVNLIMHTGVKLHFRDFKVQNIVTVGYCGFDLDLMSIVSTASGCISYEPDLFPGLEYKVPIVTVGPEGEESTGTLVINSSQSGRCVVTGGRDRADVWRAWKRFHTDVLLKNVAHVNHGSSGNYRVAQHHQLSKEADSWRLQQIVRSIAPEDVDLLRDKSDLEQLELSLSPEIVAIQRMYVHITGDPVCHGVEFAPTAYKRPRSD
jgi:transcription initiation factor TFIID TATA-box-binding protein